MKKFNYNKLEYPFKEIIETVFNTPELNELNDNVSIFTREKDQHTVWHKIYYQWARTDQFIELYDRFILQYIRPLYNNSIIYQAIPTFRVCYPNNIAVGEFHKDKYYRDEDWAAVVQEDNFFLPITDAFDTNTIWVESQEDKGDYSPINCLYGEFVQWDGSNLMHGNKINTTGKARVSVDFRVIKTDKYIPSKHTSINTKTRFEVGGYYKKTKI